MVKCIKEDIEADGVLHYYDAWTSRLLCCKDPGCGHTTLSKRYYSYMLQIVLILQKFWSWKLMELVGWCWIRYHLFGR